MANNPPTVTVTSPGAGQVVIPGQSFQLAFFVTAGSSAITTFQANLSTNGGATFGGLLGGNATAGSNVVSATIPLGTPATTIALIQVKVNDSGGLFGTGNSAGFNIGSPVLLVNPLISGKKFFTGAAGSGIHSGATVTLNGDTWALTLSDDGTTWMVFKSDRAISGPDGNIKFKSFVNSFSGTNVTIFVTNTDGSRSASQSIPVP